MSEDWQEKVRQYRAEHVPPNPKTRTFPVAQGGCPLCGHMTYPDYSDPWCPCEDCHTGGYFIRAKPIEKAG